MKCQAQVERVTGHSNVAGFRRGARMVHTEYGPCTRRAAGKLGGLCFCTQHMKLALENLIDEKGVVADRNSLADVRRYPKKFVNGLYTWANGLKPEPLEAPEPSEPRVLDNGDGRILMGFTCGELRNILNFVPTRSVRERCIKGLMLLDPESAKEFDVDL